MYLTNDSHLAQEPAAFDRAWDSPQSVVILPNKIADESWIQDRLELMQGPLRKGHFALLTSGSSGRPKLVIGRKARAEALASVLHDLQDNGVAKRALIALPLSYSFSFVNQWIWAKLHGKARCVSRGLKEPAAFGEELASETETMLCLVGAQVPLLLRHFEGKSFPGIRRLHFAGGPFPQSRLAEIRDLFPQAQITNNYGCTEAMPRLTLRRASEHDDFKNVGRPLPGIELKTDQEAKVWFRSPFSAVAEISEEGLRAYEPNAWLPVGDLGEIDEQGALTVLGRTGCVFKRYGEKISLPELLETTRKVWPGRAEFYLDDDAAGEPGHVLVIDAPADAPEHRAILRAMRAGHPRSHWPIRIELLRQFPVLPNGKPDLRSLKTIRKDEILWRQRL